MNFHFTIKYSKRGKGKTIKIYARSYNIEIIKDKEGKINYPLAQLEASNSVIKDLFEDLLNEIKSSSL